MQDSDGLTYPKVVRPKRGGFKINNRQGWTPPEGGMEKASEGMYFPGSIRGAFGGMQLGLNANESMQKQMIDVVDAKLSIACGAVDVVIQHKINFGGWLIAWCIDWILFGPRRDKSVKTGLPVLYSSSQFNRGSIDERAPQQRSPRRISRQDSPDSQG